jgi:tetratricopeptide (TPR) repeat protein
MFFTKKGQTNEAVKNLESALELAKTAYREKPDVILAEIHFLLGVKLMEDTQQNLNKSLQHLQEAKKVMDQILVLEPDQPSNAHFTSVILLTMGKNFNRRGDFVKALECFGDALKSCGKNYDDFMGELCSAFASTAESLHKVSLAKEYYTKAIKKRKKMSDIYRLGYVCEALGDQDEALKHFEEARKIAKDAGSKDCIVVNLLFLLMKKYAKMGNMNDSMQCYAEAGEIAKSLPANNCLPPETLEMLKSTNKTGVVYLLKLMKPT